MADYNKLKENKEKAWFIKADVNLKETLDNIQRFRFGKGLDKKPVPYPSLIKAAFRFEPLLDILKKAEIKKDEK